VAVLSKYRGSEKVVQTLSSRNVSNGGRRTVRISLDAKVPLKALDHSLDAEDHSDRDVFQIASRNLIDRYVEREIGIDVNVCTSDIVSDLESRDLAVVFQNGSMVKVAEFERHSFGQLESNCPVGWGRTNEVQSSVSVDSCPVIQDQQGLAHVPRPALTGAADSLVRLYSFNEEPHVVREWHTTHKTLKFRLLGADREIPLLLIGGRIFPEFDDGSVIDTRIESAAELIEQLSKLERERDDPISVNRLDEQCPCPIRFYLGLSNVHLICLKAVPDFSQGLPVGLRAPDTQPTPFEW
jgi:hypothetical protein